MSKEIIFNNEFIENLPEESLDALKKIRNYFIEWHEHLGKTHADNVNNYLTFIEAYVFLIVYLENFEIPHNLPNITLDNKESKINGILNAFYKGIPEIITDLEKELSSKLFDESITKYRAKLGTGFAYEFSEGD
jgi:hypothetical protein